MPALALKDNKSNNWEPVGEEILYAVVKEDAGYMIAFCDKNGIAKSIAQWFSEDVKNGIIVTLKVPSKPFKNTLGSYRFLSSSTSSH